MESFKRINEEKNEISKKQKNENYIKLKSFGSANTWDIQTLEDFNIQFNDLNELKHKEYTSNINNENPILKNLLNNATDEIIKTILNPVKDIANKSLTELEEKDIYLHNFLKLLKLISSDQEIAESNVDAFTRELLTIFGFLSSKNKLNIINNNRTSFKSKSCENEGHECVAIPDVSVTHMESKLIQFLVIEDKVKLNLKDEPQAQAVAQIISAYINNKLNLSNKSDKDNIIKYKFPFMTIRGQYICFYQVTNMTDYYIECIQNGIKPTDTLIINRYSIDGKYNNAKPTGYSFNIPDERKMILGILFMFRDYILNVTKQIYKY